MARKLNRLSARTVAGLGKPGRYGDGGNLYLLVDRNGSKRWTFLFRFDGRSCAMDLGRLPSVPLAEARRLAGECRTKLTKGINPVESRQTELFIPSFGQCADEFVAGMSGRWRNEKHKAQWRMTLTEYAAPIRSLPVNTIETADVLRVIKPLWHRVPETASRLRGRIERVLEAARSRGFRTGENPARWRGHLDQLLPARQPTPVSESGKAPR
jgi:Phage integrase central domain/Arm DNA-binding domain